MTVRLPLLIGCLLLSTGCVERWLFIRTEPAGARIFLDGRELGTSPVKEPFYFYGTREVLARMSPKHMDRHAPSYASKAVLVHLSPPWYEYFPIDFFTELLWPFELEDVHEVTLKLSPADKERLKKRVIEGLQKGPPQPNAATREAKNPSEGG